ncbi:MAG: hypothetical protein ACFHHU_01635 [Porticoccaceae bacterium]
MFKPRFDNRYYGRPDARQLPTHTDAAKWNNYCPRRMETTLDHGELHVAAPVRQHNKEDLMPYYHEFLRLAETGGVDAAMAYASENLVEQDPALATMRSKKPRNRRNRLAPSMVCPVWLPKM